MTKIDRPYTPTIPFPSACLGRHAHLSQEVSNLIETHAIVPHFDDSIFLTFSVIRSVGNQFGEG